MLLRSIYPVLIGNKAIPNIWRKTTRFGNKRTKF